MRSTGADRRGAIDESCAKIEVRDELLEIVREMNDALGD